MADPLVLAITQQQVEGIKARQSAIELAERAQREYVAAILDGHGLKDVQVVSVNDETNTLTVQPV